MDQITLRIVGSEQPGLSLAEGMHGIGRNPDGSIGWVAQAAAAVRFCTDRRGVWLTLGDDVLGIHVNGRPVQRMAMLRMGDTVHVDGVEIVLTGSAPPALPSSLGADTSQSDQDDPRMVLRGIGGHYHGRSFTLDHSRLVGSGSDCDIRIDDPVFAQHHCRIALQDDGSIALRDLGSDEGSIVNGMPVRDALLRPGDQVVFDSHQRFVVETPGGAMRPEPSLADGIGEASLGQGGDEAIHSGLAGNVRRLPWLLLAAVLIAAALSGLLLFGVSG